MTTNFNSASHLQTPGEDMQSWTQCPKCGIFYPKGETHVCSDSFSADSSSTAATYWTCSICGERIPNGEIHLCGERAKLGPAAGVWGLAAEPPSKATGYWTCSNCGQRIRYGEMHICGGKSDSGSWPLRPEWPFDGWPYDDNVTTLHADLELRRINALERIADALEKIAQGGG